jgi:hypothetical protein
MRMTPRAAAAAACCCLLAGAPLRAGADQGDLPAAAAQGIAAIRRNTGCAVPPTDDVAQELEFRGRASIEVNGRQRDGDAPGAIRDFAIFTPALGRVVSYTCFVNASTRRSGEAIVSLAVASGRGDQLLRALLPGLGLELESIRRHRASGAESIYYEARYASTSGQIPFLEPPVRLLLNATTGDFFRFDVAADWLDPPAAPRIPISRKAAERIATVVLRSRDLAAAFGAGAAFEKVAAAELFIVQPNEWLGFFTERAETRARAAWVVPFRLGGGIGGLQRLFVDAATGRILGGLAEHAGGPPP